MENFVKKFVTKNFVTILINNFNWVVINVFINFIECQKYFTIKIFMSNLFINSSVFIKLFTKLIEELIAFRFIKDYLQNSNLYPMIIS